MGKKIADRCNVSYVCLVVFLSHKLFDNEQRTKLLNSTNSQILINLIFFFFYESKKNQQIVNSLAWRLPLGFAPRIARLTFAFRPSIMGLGSLQALSAAGRSPMITCKHNIQNTKNPPLGIFTFHRQFHSKVKKKKNKKIHHNEIQEG